MNQEVWYLHFEHSVGGIIPLVFLLMTFQMQDDRTQQKNNYLT